MTDSQSICSGSFLVHKPTPSVVDEPSVVSDLDPMCAESPAETNQMTQEKKSPAMVALTGVIAVCCIIGVVMIGVLISTVNSTNMAPTIIVGGSTESAPSMGSTTSSVAGPDVPDTVPSVVSGDNYCAGKNPNIPNLECIIDEMTNPAVGPQAGSNITRGYKGEMDVEYEPITTPYYQAGLCPVNVHWHLGAEHYSLGEFDENGKGIREIEWYLEGGKNSEDDMGSFQCYHYDETDPKFTKQYDWKHCVGMEVGQTYEVHWPHSAAGACGTPNQYQTPFYDGVFCRGGIISLAPLNTYQKIGVQSQVYTIVNDEAYYNPDMIRGMIVDGEYGADVAKYTGSTTGTSRDNTICSRYTPITWQVDRKCHLISASSFDKMCANMKAQTDDMSMDVYPHGSRELVADHLAANNLVRRD